MFYCSIAGFESAVTIQTLSEDENIEKVEQFARTFEQILNFCQVLPNQVEHVQKCIKKLIFGLYASSINNFKFLIGDIVLIKQIANIIITKINQFPGSSAGYAYFSRKPKSKYVYVTETPIGSLFVGRHGRDDIGATCPKNAHLKTQSSEQKSEKSLKTVNTEPESSSNSSNSSNSISLEELKRSDSSKRGSFEAMVKTLTKSGIDCVVDILKKFTIEYPGEVKFMNKIGLTSTEGLLSPGSPIKIDLFGPDLEAARQILFSITNEGKIVIRGDVRCYCGIRSRGHFKVPNRLKALVNNENDENEENFQSNSQFDQDFQSSWRLSNFQRHLKSHLRRHQNNNEEVINTVDAIGAIHTNNSEMAGSTNSTNRSNISNEANASMGPTSSVSAINLSSVFNFSSN